MAAPTSTNEVTARKLSASISALWTKIKSIFQPVADRVTAWGSTPSDTKYPSEKLVKTSLDSSVLYANQKWGGAFRVSLSPIDVFGMMGHNVFLGAFASCIKVEYSTDGGTTWLDYGLTDTQKMTLFSQFNNSAIAYCGKNTHIQPGYTGTIAGTKDLTNGIIANQRLRITISSRPFANEGTTSRTGEFAIIARIRRLGILMSTQSASAGTHCVISTRSTANFEAGNDVWATHGDFSILGDGGWNSIPCDNGTAENGFTFGGYGTGGVAQYNEIRFEIWSSQLNANPASSQTGNLAIYAICGLADRINSTNSKFHAFARYGYNCTSVDLANGYPVFGNGIKFTARKLKTNLARTADSTFDGSADQTNIPVTGTLPIGNGGTGKTTAKAAEYNLTTGKSEISDTTSGDDRVVFELASPSESNGVTRGFRKLSTIWAWIKGLLSSESGVNISGNAATATKATQDSDGNPINATYFKSSGNTTLVAGAATKIGTQNGADVKLTLPTIPAAVRVKGDAESSYRTGDVNLTPANIGLTDAAIRGKISAGTDLSYDSSTGVMKVDTTGTATGNYAFASGAATTASGNYSHAEGYSATASSTSAHAEGSRTVASTPAAHAEGHRTTASGISAHAEGYRDDGDEFAGFSVASGFGSHIEGIDTKASDDASHAEGYLTESSGPHAHAEGESTVASGKDSHAEGLWSNASGLNSHAENSSFAYGENAHSEGYGQSSWGAAGVASHTEGSAAFAYGMSAHAEGGGTNALGKDSHAEGLGGGYRPVAITLTADHVAETSTFTGSTEGLSVGMYLLWKDDAHLTQQVSKITWIGNGTFGTQAAFDSAIPAGTVVYAVDRGVAAGTASHVEGFGTSAVGTYAHAEGYLTKAIGEASHAEGQGTEARTGGMHAAGMYPATKEGFARVTGWGSAASPKDIERLGTQGTLWVSGHFYGATPLKVVPGQTTYDEIYEAWSEQRPFVIEVSMLTHMAHAIYAPAIIRAVPLDQAMDHWEFHFKVEYPYNYRASFYAGGQEPYKVSIYYLAINEQQGWGKLVSGTNEWASLSDSRWYSVPVEYAALAETATEAQNAAANSPLASAISGKSDVGHKHPISDLTMGILSASLGGTGYNNLSDACSAILKAVTLGTDTTMYADDEIMGSSHTSGATDTSKFVRRKASTMKAYVLNGGTMTGQFTNSYQGYGYQASHGTSNKYVGFKAYREDTQVGVSLEVGSNGKAHGVYSSKLGTWIISERDDNKIHIYNDRLIINSAGALRGSGGVVTITNVAENAGGVLSAGALRQTSFISKSGEFEVTNTDATVRGNGQLYFYRNTNATSAILAKWHVNSASTFATGYIQPGCTGVFQLTDNSNNYFTRLS